MNPALKPFFRQIQFLYWALLGGLITFFIASIAVARILTQQELPDFRWLVFAAPISGMALLILAHRLYSKKLAEAAAMGKLHKRIEGFRTATILRFLVLDFAGVLNLGAFTVTGNYLFFGLAGVVILLFVLYRPTITLMAKDLKLEGLEKEMIFDPTPPKASKGK